jgi:hypothetical protein
MDYDQQEREFAPLIGKGIMNFGLVEFGILQATEFLAGEAACEKAAKLPFARRVKFLIQILNDRNRKGAAVARLIDLLNQALALAHKRNMIAHNPLTIEILWENEKYNYAPVVCKYLDRDNKVTKADLFTFCRDIENLAEELSDAIHGVLTER